MKINDLLVINEAGPRSAAQQASMQAAASGVNPPNNPFGLKVVQGGAGQQAPSTTSPTGDPTLDKPLPAAAPKDPNAPGLGTKIGRGVGQVAKGIGAVAGGVTGIGRAVKKGYQAGVQTVGGPGAPAAAAPSAPAGTSSPGVTDQEFNDLIARIQKIEQILNRKP